MQCIVLDKMVRLKFKLKGICRLLVHYPDVISFRKFFTLKQFTLISLKSNPAWGTKRSCISTRGKMLELTIMEYRRLISKTNTLQTRTRVQFPSERGDERVYAIIFGICLTLAQ